MLGEGMGPQVWCGGGGAIPQVWCLGGTLPCDLSQDVFDVTYSHHPSVNRQMPVKRLPSQTSLAGGNESPLQWMEQTADCDIVAQCEQIERRHSP